MPYLDPAIYGYALQSDADFSKSSSHNQIEVLNGRARYRLRDPNAVFIMSISYRWTDDQMRQFRQFWDVDLDHGTDWFEVDLQLGTSVALGDPMLKRYSVHATQTYQVTLSAAGVVNILMPIEVRRVPLP